MRDWNARLSSTDQARDQVELLKHQARAGRAATPRGRHRRVRRPARRRAGSRRHRPRSRPAIRCSSVLLPLPDSPVSATLSPAATSQVHAAQHRDLLRRPSDRLLVRSRDAQHDRLPLVMRERAMPHSGFWYFSTNSSTGTCGRNTAASRGSSGWRRKSPSADELETGRLDLLRAARSPRSGAASWPR